MGLSCVILINMTKETPNPKNAEAEVKAVRPTVFSDGSTFDYVNGYQSNGAPAATRDRTEVPRIAKAGALMSTNTLANIMIAFILLAVLAFASFLGFTSFHNQANEKAIVSLINTSGQAEVIGGKILKEGDRNIVVVRDSGDNKVYRCDVHVVVETSATGLVFCNPGEVNFTLPVPYDPANIFYTTPAQDK